MPWCRVWTEAKVSLATYHRLSLSVSIFPLICWVNTRMNRMSSVCMKLAREMKKTYWELNESDLMWFAWEVRRHFLPVFGSNSKKGTSLVCVLKVRFHLFLSFTHCIQYSAVDISLHVILVNIFVIKSLNPQSSLVASQSKSLPLSMCLAACRWHSHHLLRPYHRSSFTWLTNSLLCLF